jgi:nucleoside-diphosphate-sugar epimerase
MKIVVTGYSGFLGKKVATYFVKKGHTVFGVSRTDGNVEGVIFIPLDLRQESAISFDDAAIIHCAADTNEGWNPKIVQANIAITKNALKLSTGTFINISSSSVYDLSKPSMHVEEIASKLKHSYFNSYSLSKSLTEKIVEESNKQSAITLRPHGIYGEGDTTLLPRLQGRIKKGKIILPESGQVLHSLTHIDNLVSAIMLSLESNLAGYHVFNITDSHPITIAEAVCRATGQDIKIMNLSLKNGLKLAFLSEKFISVIKEPKISQYSILQLGMERTYDISKALSLLGYTPTGNMIKAF